jgi:hypothetical protein
MYTNIVDIPESILFLTSARLAVREVVKVSDTLDEHMKEYVSYFVMNEATDYQIMSMVVGEEFSEEKHNLEDELYLFDQFKEMVVENYHEFSTFMEKEDIFSLIYEIGPISGEGLSTAVPILEHLFESGILHEKPRKTVADLAFDARFKARGLKKSIPHRVKGIAATGKGAAKDVSATASKYASKAAEKGRNVAFDARFKARGLKKSIPHRAKGLAKTVVKSTAGKVVGAVALATAAIYAGVKVYQRFMGAAAKACSGQSGSARGACVNKYKAGALKGQIAATSQGMAKCGAAKNPDKCKQAIQNRVVSLKGKLSKVAAAA